MHTPREIEIAQAIAAQTGAAIRLARLYAQSERRRTQLQDALRQFGSVLASSTDLAATLDGLAELAAGMTKAEVSAVFRVRDDRVEVAAAWGAEPSGAVPSVTHAGSRVERVIASGEPVHLTILGDGREVPSGGRGDAAGWAFLAVPLILGDAVVGALAVTRRGGPFDPDEIDLLATFGRGAAVAIQRGEILEALERRVVELSGLQRLAQAIATISSIEETLDHLVRSIATLLNAERCVVLLLQPDTGVLAGRSPAVGISPETVATLSIPPEADSASLRALSSGEPFVSNAARSDPALLKAWVTALNDTNILIAPMRVGDAPIGVIRVSNKPGGFEADDVRLLSIFAGQAAVVIQNVMLFEREQPEAIIRSTSDAILIVDAAANVVRMNPAAERLTGWTPSAAAGRPVRDVLTLRVRDGRSATMHPLEWVLRNESHIPYTEQEFRTRDGREVEISRPATRTFPAWRASRASAWASCAT
ncbi:MAG: GAF domain-containing protein [Actinobacteria bacterium]|nr:GAF domain-containing protein [Actinomycetota bacterium]